MRFELDERNKAWGLCELEENTRRKVEELEAGEWGASEQRELPLLLPSPETLNPPNLSIIEPELVFFQKSGLVLIPVHPRTGPLVPVPKNHYLEPGESVPPRFYNQASKLVPVSNWFLRPEPVPVWFQLPKIVSKYSSWVLGTQNQNRRLGSS